jgi:hypothetical protein
MPKRIDWAEVNEACEALSENEDSLTRDPFCGTSDG